jgi:hypothetical protein
MMKDHNPDNSSKLNPESDSSFNNLPVYNPEMGNEGGINYHQGKIKSHSFSVRDPHFLASENIIFEPGDSGFEK